MAALCTSHPMLITYDMLFIVAHWNGSTTQKKEKLYEHLWSIRGKNDQRSKILLDLLQIWRQFCWNFKNNERCCCKKFWYSGNKFERLFYIIILIVQLNYFPNLYSTKILTLLAKPFFPCRCESCKLAQMKCKWNVE